MGNSTHPAAMDWLACTVAFRHALMHCGHRVACHSAIQCVSTDVEWLMPLNSEKQSVASFW